MKVTWRSLVLMCLCILVAAGALGCTTCTACKNAGIKNKAYEEEYARVKEEWRKASKEQRAVMVEADAKRVEKECPTLAKWIRKGRLVKDHRGFYHEWPLNE